MGNTISHVTDWIDRVLAERENIQSEIALCIVFAFVFYTFMFDRNRLRSWFLLWFYKGDSNNYGWHDIDDMIARLKRYCEAMKMNEAIYYNLNFREYKSMICEKYPDETDRSGLRGAINAVKKLMKRNINTTVKLNVLTPMIRDLIEENPPDELEVEDALTTLKLIKQSLGQTRPRSIQNLRFGDSIYPRPMERRINKIKEILEKCDICLEIMLDDKLEHNKDGLLFMLRKAKINLLENEMRALERVMRQKSIEYWDAHQPEDESDVSLDDIIDQIPDFLFHENNKRP